jgi:hypothetical protein
MSVLQKLTEGVQHRDMQAEGAALLNKWEATGLLEGLNQGQQKQGMAVLLENQAKELLREASSMAAGDVEGFAAVAFPIVRRVFGGLIANDLISVQPMSLPSGLIFFLDFTHNSARAGFGADGSLYGGGVVGREIVDGVKNIEDTGFYGLSSGYSAATAEAESGAAANTAAIIATPEQDSTMDFDADLKGQQVIRVALSKTAAARATATELAQMDPGAPRALTVGFSDGSGAAGQPAVLNGDQVQHFIDDNGDLLIAAQVVGNTICMGVPDADTADNDLLISRMRQVRRLTKATTSTSSEGLKVVTSVDSVVYRLISITDCGAVGDAGATTGHDALSEVKTLETAGVAVTLSSTHTTAVAVDFTASNLMLTFPVRDDINASSNAVGALVGGLMPLEEASNSAGVPAGGASSDSKNAIAEIDIKVDSIAVTAQTKKLKAKWSPELGQDLNAYHNLDAEVELTGILSEQIALEIDRELLGELVDGATAGKRYWSRAPGLFVDSLGVEQGASSAAPDFTGTVSEWYETLIETINDVSAQIHRKTLRGGANFVVCSPEVANILEFTSGFRASVTADQDRGTIGAIKSGSLSKKFDVYVDPYFLRNVLLVGRKGSSFLESGYVYAPYVPLQVTPTIFGTEDFVPRKGVMTRYAKKMVRPDMYGLVIVRGLLGESGG